MTLTLTQMETRVESYIDDPDNDYVTQTEIWAWLNDAQQDLATRLKTIRKEATGTQSAADYTLALPSGFIDVLSLRLTSDDCEFVDDEVWHSWYDADEDPGYTLARVFGTNIELYPTPTESVAYVLRYIGLPAVMTAGSDVSELPIGWAIRATYYAISQSWAKRDDMGQHDRWLARYEDNLPGLDTGREKFSGAVTLTVAAGPFDLDPGRMHN